MINVLLRPTTASFEEPRFKIRTAKYVEQVRGQRLPINRWRNGSFGGPDSWTRDIF